MAVTLQELRTRCLERADMVFNSAVAAGDRYITTTELNALINTSYAELYGTLVRYGMHRDEELATVVTDGTAKYQLPADIYAVLGVYRVETNGDRTYLSRHDHRLRPNQSRTQAKAHTYRVVGANMEFNPIPTSGTYELVYIPVPGEMSADEDQIDGVLGWEEYVVIDVAIKLKQKEDSDPALLMAERERLLRRIQEESRDEEMSECGTVQSVRNTSGRRLIPGCDWDYAPDWWY